MPDIQGTRWVHVLAEYDGTPIVVSETGPAHLRKIAGPNHLIFEAALIYMQRVSGDPEPPQRR